MRVFKLFMKQLQKAVVLICLGILPLLLIITRLTSHNCAEVPTTSDFYFGGTTAYKPARSGPGPPNTRPKPQPIDVVYTWVNGSDPNFKRSLKKQARKFFQHFSQIFLISKQTKFTKFTKFLNLPILILTFNSVIRHIRLSVWINQDINLVTR